MARNNNGFTLLEVLLSVSIIGMVVAVSMPVYVGMLTKNDLDVAAATVAQSIRRAAIRSQGVDGDTGWGVKVQNGASTIFKGNTFASRDTAFDETTSVSPNITVSGLSEIILTKFTGVPVATGTLTLATGHDTATISVNAQGTVSY